MKGLTNYLPFTKSYAWILDELSLLKESWRREHIGKVVDIVHVDFSEAFNTITHNILTEKLMKYRLDKQTVRCIENWLNCQVISLMKSSSRPANCRVLKRLIEQYWVVSSLVTSIRAECIHSKFADDTELGGVVHIPHEMETQPVFPFSRLGKWADKNFMKYSKGTS